MSANQSMRLAIVDDDEGARSGLPVDINDVVRDVIDLANSETPS